MGEPNDTGQVMRSLLFVPGHIEKMVNKAPSTATDCIVFDLEDAVPPRNKEEARACIRTALESGRYAAKTTFVRINPIDSGLTLQDLDAVACKELDGFVYPMAFDGDDIKKFDAQLSLMESHLELPRGHFSIVALIETAAAVLNTQEIACASSRVVGLMFGCEDYLAGMDARHTDLDISLHHPRMMVALAARAAGVAAIDTPFVQVHDTEGLEAFAKRARNLGMGGMVVLSPKQVAVANEIYSPTAEEITFANDVAAAAVEAEKQGMGVVIVDGKFISPPTLKAAMRVLDRHRAIGELEKRSGDGK
ncbi:MAG: CoA ester lyase [bacterium]|nr:CoA ester lyase [bacterium]